MSIQCLLDGEIRDTFWLYLNDGWVSAITVCNQNLSPVFVPESQGMTFRIVDLEIADNATNIIPSANRTICRFSDIISGELTVTADVSSCELGDELIIIFSQNNGQLIFNYDTFNINGSEGEGTFSFSANTEDWALAFTFNGTKFISTYEHC